MKIKCLKCGRVIPVGVYWHSLECPGCGCRHVRLDSEPTWELAGDPEDWLCWSCGQTFEVWHVGGVDANCPHCHARNERHDSLVVPVEVPSVL